MFLGITGEVVMWNKEMTACSLVVVENPLAEYVELPPKLTNRLFLAVYAGFRLATRPRWYSNLICGVIRGCLEQLQLRVEARFEKDALNGLSDSVLGLKSEATWKRIRVHVTDIAICLNTFYNYDVNNTKAGKQERI